MNHARTLARPYARALFELAHSQHTLDWWSHALALLATCAQNATLQNYYREPQQKRHQIVELFYAIAEKAGYANSTVKNLLLLLNEYRRLLLLPAIANLFEEAKARQEKMLLLTVTSAFPVTSTLRTRLQDTLEKRLERAINITWQQDSALLGGLIVRAGDMVIDASVKSQLTKLKQAMISE